MKLKLLPILLLLPFLFVSCAEDDDEKGKLNLTFKAVYGGEPLVLNSETYDYFDGNKISFSKLNLFVSDVTVLDASSSVEVIDISFIDFLESNTTSAGAQSGYVLSTEMEEGSYTNLNFGLGVASDLNAMDPGSFPNDHPLAQSGQFWSVWDSYIFSKTEGRYDTDGDGVPELGFAYHLGGDELYREVNFASSGINIVGGETTNLIIQIDFKSLFGLTIGGIDIQATPSFHNPNDPSQAALGFIMADNYMNSVTVSEQ